MSDAYAEQLLDHAFDVAVSVDSSPAALGRAVSTAYYALFHLLTGDATSLIVPPGQPRLAEFVRRSFSHSDMKKVCALVAREDSRTAIGLVLSPPIEADLVDVAQAFCDLQSSRQRADYSADQPLDEKQIAGLIDQASQAFRCWRRVRDTDNAQAFSVALLLAKSWRVE